MKEEYSIEERERERVEGEGRVFDRGERVEGEGRVVDRGGGR